MPWKERKALDEKKSFIAEWEREEESLAELCRRMKLAGKTATNGSIDINKKAILI